MTMTKFTKASEWKTRGGWRAMITDVSGEQMIVWHDTGLNNATFKHSFHVGEYSSAPSDYDLIEPWAKPVEHNMWLDISKWSSETFEAYLYSTEEGCISDIDKHTVARIPIKFTEGEGL